MTLTTRAREHRGLRAIRLAAVPWEGILAEVQTTVPDAQSKEGPSKVPGPTPSLMPGACNELSRICLQASDDKELTPCFRYKQIYLILSLNKPLVIHPPLDHTEQRLKDTQTPL